MPIKMYSVLFHMPYSRTLREEELCHGRRWDEFEPRTRVLRVCMVDI